MSFKLSNQDFRNLVSAASQTPSGDEEGKRVCQKNKTTKERHYQRYLQILSRQKKRELQGDRSSTQTVKFRDRAAERRRNEMQQRDPSKSCAIPKELTFEESQFLGGDEEHTHLVKGLDYVLLNKTRAALEKKAATGTFSCEAVTQPPPPTQGISVDSTVSATEAQRVIEALRSGLHMHHNAFPKKLERVEWTIHQGSHFYGNTPFFRTKSSLYQFNVEPNAPSLPLCIVLGLSCATSSKTYCLPLPENLLKVIQEGDKGFKTGADSVVSLGAQVASVCGPCPSEEEEEEDDIFVNVGRFKTEEVLSEEILKRETPIQEFIHTTAQGESNSPQTLPSFRVTDPESLFQSHSNSATSPHHSAETVEDRPRAREGRKKDVAPQPLSYQECYPQETQTLSALPRDGWGMSSTVAKSKKGSKSWNFPADSKKSSGKPISGRSARRQAEREWKKIEEYIEVKKHRKLDALEEDVCRHTSKTVSQENLFNLV